jgi:hypothetical protein
MASLEAHFQGQRERERTEDHYQADVANGRYDVEEPAAR